MSSIATDGEYRLFLALMLCRNRQKYIVSAPVIKLFLDIFFISLQERVMCCVNVSKALSNDFGTCRIDLKQQYHRPLLKHTVLLSGGRIDHGHHDGQAVRALNDAVAMAKACGKAMEMTNRGK